MVLSNIKLCCLSFPLCLLQGSITDDKSKATHHIYPSPSQQEEGRVELCIFFTDIVICLPRGDNLWNQKLFIFDKNYEESKTEKTLKTNISYYDTKYHMW